MLTAYVWLWAGAAGGAVYDLDRHAEQRYPAQQAIRPLAASAALASRLLRWGARRMRASEATVRRRPLQQTTTLPATLATSLVVTAAGTGLTPSRLVSGSPKACCRSRISACRAAAMSPTS